MLSDGTPSRGTELSGFGGTRGGTPKSIVDDKDEVLKRLHSVRWGYSYALNRAALLAPVRRKHVVASTSRAENNTPTPAGDFGLLSYIQ